MELEKRGVVAGSGLGRVRKSLIPTELQLQGLPET